MTGWDLQLCRVLGCPGLLTHEHRDHVLHLLPLLIFPILSFLFMFYSWSSWATFVHHFLFIWLTSCTRQGPFTHPTYIPSSSGWSSSLFPAFFLWRQSWKSFSWIYLVPQQSSPTQSQKCSCIVGGGIWENEVFRPLPECESGIPMFLFGLWCCMHGSTVARLKGKPQQPVMKLGPFIALQVRPSLCSRCRHVDVVTHRILLSPTIFPGHLLVLDCIPKSQDWEGGLSEGCP